MNFEDTHIIDRERIKKLIGLLAVAFCWHIKPGNGCHEQRPIKIKKHGRAEVSLFRYGLDYLVDVLANLFFKLDLFKDSVTGCHTESKG